MTFFWLVMAALALLALIFVAWPFVKYRNNSDSAAAIAMQPEARLAENVALFKEHLAELEAQLRDERIEQAQYEQLKHELQRSLLDDEADIRARSQGSSKGASWGIFVLIAALLLVGAFALYEHLGSRADVQIEALQAKKQYDDYQQMLAGRAPNSTLALELAQVIEARLASDPESVQYWFILARTYMEVNDFAKAAAAYSQVLKRDQESGMVMAEAAQAIFLRDGNQVSFPVENLAKTALKLEPQNTMALGLMGIVAFNKKQYSAAIQYWQQATAILGDSSSGSASLKTGIERAKALLSEEGEVAAEPTAAATKVSILLNVLVGPNVKARPDQLVYIYARAWNGAKMPLAITRIPLSDLPKTVELTEAMAMSPAMTLATASQVELVARISQDGSAITQSGDWQASFGPVDLKAIPENITLTINEQVP